MVTCSLSRDWYQYYLSRVPKFNPTWIGGGNPAPAISNCQVRYDPGGGNLRKYCDTSLLFDQVLGLFNARVTVINSEVDAYLHDVCVDVIKCIDQGSTDVDNGNAYFTSALSLWSSSVTSSNLAQAHLTEANAMVTFYMSIFTSGYPAGTGPIIDNGGLSNVNRPANFSHDVSVAISSVSSHYTTMVTNYNYWLNDYINQAKAKLLILQVAAYNTRLAAYKSSLNSLVSSAVSSLSCSSFLSGKESALASLNTKVTSAISLIPAVKACTDFQSAFNQYASLMGSNGTLFNSCASEYQSVVNSFNSSLKALPIYANPSIPNENGKAFIDLANAAIATVTTAAQSQTGVYSARLDAHVRAIGCIRSFYVPAFNGSLGSLSTALDSMITNLTSMAVATEPISVGTEADNAYQSVVDYYLNQLGGGPSGTSVILDPYNLFSTSLISALNTAIGSLVVVANPSTSSTTEFTDPAKVLTDGITALNTSTQKAVSDKIKAASESASAIIQHMYDVAFDKRVAYYVSTSKSFADDAVASIGSYLDVAKLSFDSILSSLDSDIQDAIDLIPSTEADSAYQTAINKFNSRFGGSHERSPTVDTFNSSVSSALNTFNTSLSSLSIYPRVDPEGDLISLVTTKGFSSSVSSDGVFVCPLFDASSTSTFTIVDNPDDTISFIASNGKYLTCGPDGNLSFLSSSVGPNEKFIPTWDGTKLSLKGSNGKYVSAVGGGGAAITATSTTKGLNETFTTTRVNTVSFTAPRDNAVEQVNSAVSDVSNALSDEISSCSNRASAIIRKMYDAAYAKFKSEADQGIADLSVNIKKANDVYNGYLTVLASSGPPLNSALTRMKNYTHNNPIKYPLFTSALFNKLRSAKSDLSKIRSDAIQAANQSLALSSKDVDTKYKELYQAAVDSFSPVISRHTIYGSQDDDFYKYYNKIQTDAAKIIEDKSKELAFEVSVKQPMFSSTMAEFSNSSQKLIDTFVSNRPVLRLTGVMSIPHLDYEGDNDFRFEIENKGGGSWQGSFAMKFLNWELDDDPNSSTYDTYRYKAYIWDKGLNHYSIRPGEKVMIRNVVPFDRLFQGAKLGGLKFNIVPITESGI